MRNLRLNVFTYTLWLFNIAMENGPFIDGLPNKMVIFHGYFSLPEGIFVLSMPSWDKDPQRTNVFR